MPEPDGAMIGRFYRDVGGRVRTARVSKRLTQEDLASKLGLTRSSVANLEAGRQRVPLHVLVLISELLETPISELLPKRSIFDQVDDFFNVHEQLAIAEESTRDFISGAITGLIINPKESTE